MVLHETTFYTDEGMFRLFTHLSADYRLRHLVNNVAIHIYTHDYIRMEITILFEHITVSIVDLMVLHETIIFTDDRMFRLFTHLSADYCLRHIVNKVAIHIYAHD